MSLSRAVRRQRKKEEVQSVRKRRSKLLFEPLEPRILLSADSLLSGLTTSMEAGLTSFSDKVQGYVETELDFQTLMPGILQIYRDLDGNGVIDERDVHIPSEVTVAVDYDRNGRIDENIFVPGRLTEAQKNNLNVVYNVSV